jgi:hypothetical protein
MMKKPSSPCLARNILCPIFSFAFIFYTALVDPSAILAGSPPPATVTLDQDLPDTSLQSEGAIPAAVPPQKASKASKGTQPKIPSSPKNTQSSNVRINWFPDQDPFTPLLADPRQPTSSGNFFFLSNEAYGQFNGNFGADLGIVRIESSSEGINRSIQIGVMGASFSRFALIGASTFLVDTDFVIGIPVTFRIDQFSTRIFFYHESSHTGYDYMTYFNLTQTDNFGQEVLQVIPSWDITPHIRIYGGAAYRVIGLYYYSTFADSLILQTGFEIYTQQLRKFQSRGYLAFNLESRGINGYSPDTDLQVGLLFHKPKAFYQLRTAIDFFNGYSPMGDFLFNREQYVSIGLYFDF